MLENVCNAIAVSDHCVPYPLDTRTILNYGIGPTIVLQLGLQHYSLAHGTEPSAQEDLGLSYPFVQNGPRPSTTLALYTL